MVKFGAKVPTVGGSSSSTTKCVLADIGRQRQPAQQTSLAWHRSRTASCLAAWGVPVRIPQRLLQAITNSCWLPTAASCPACCCYSEYTVLV